MSKSSSAARFYSFFHGFVKSESCTSPIWSRQTQGLNQISLRHQPYNSRQLHSTPLCQTRKESLRPQSHYEIFPQTLPSGPPPHGPFEINVRDLRREFLQLQAKTHPDLHSGEDKARAEGFSMLVNEAYKTLQNPLLRAQYLLSLKGIDVAEDETLKIEDPDLLMEVLEMRESIEAAESEEDLEPLRATNDEKIKHSVQILDQAFKNDDMNTVKEEAVRLRYWVNISESLHAWEKGKPVVLVH